MASSSTTVYVHNAVDAAADVSFCSTDTSDCNLRSAWVYCGTISSSVDPQHQCIIEIDTDLNIYMDANLGSLELGDTDYIDLVGGNASIFTFTGSGSSEGTDDAGDATDDNFASQFPVTTGGTIVNTNYGNSAANTPDPECVTAGAGDILTFSTCGDFSGDPFIFLSTKSGSFLTSNDDFCGLGSELTYTVDNIASGTAEYCLTMGCYASASCSYTVTVERIVADASSSSSSSAIATNLWPFQYSVGETFYIPSFTDDYYEYDPSQYPSQTDDVFSPTDFPTEFSTTDDVFSPTEFPTEFNPTDDVFSPTEFPTEFPTTDDVFSPTEFPTEFPTTDDVFSIGFTIGAGFTFKKVRYLVTEEVISETRHSKLAKVAAAVKLQANSATSRSKDLRRANRVRLGLESPATVGVGADGSEDAHGIAKAEAHSAAQYAANRLEGVTAADPGHTGRLLALSDAPFYSSAHSETYVAETGDLMTFSTVGFPNDEYQDTFLQLFFTETDNSLTLLQANDDFGGTLNSQISATAAAAGTYVLRASCGASAPGCYGFVQLSVLNATEVEALDAFDPRFITYESSIAPADVSVISTPGPILSVSALTINEFGSRTLSALGNAFDGGAFHLNGPAEIHVQDVSFIGNKAINGGDIYVTQNTVGHVNVGSCSLSGGVATLGGSIYLDSDVYGFTLRDSTISGSEATNGGGIYLNDGNHHVQVVDSTISGASANGNGGALYLGTDNEFFRADSLNITAGSTVGGEGGGLFLNSGNRFFTVVDSTISGCSAQDGGGVFVDNGNDNVTFQGTEISECTARSNGGGVRISSENFGMKFVESTLSLNTAAFGGAIAGDNNNPQVVLAGSTITNNSATTDGGGVYLVKNHSLFTSIDYDSYLHSITIESDHPYVSGPPTNTSSGQGTPVNILNRRITVSGCNTFVIVFNARFDINEFDTVTIAINNGEDIVFSSEGFLVPGVTLPALTISDVPDGELYISFDGTAFTNLFTSSAPALGFSMNIYPVMKPDSIAYDSASTMTRIAEEPIGEPFPYSTGIYTNISFNDLSAVCVNACVGDTLRFAAEGFGTCVGDPSAEVARAGIVLKNVTDMCTGDLLYTVGSSDVDLASGCDTYCLNLGCTGASAAANHQCKITVNGYKGESVARYYRPTEFKFNSASSNGGGLMLFTQNPFAVVTGSIFEGNSAVVNGGGVMMKNANNGAAFRNTQFLDNSVGQDGAGAMMSTAHSGVTFFDVLFDNNIADGNGGGLSMNTDNGQGLLADYNNISLVGCTFVENRAASGNGAGMYVSNDNEVFLMNTELNGNRAPLGEGGGIFVDQNNKFNVLLVSVEGNVANDNGGGFFLSRNTNATLAHVEFDSNIASLGSGGAIFINSDNTVDISDSVLTGNVAATNGGGVAVNNGNTVSLEMSTCSSNLATYGGCLSSEGSNILDFTTIDVTYNNATAMGGGLNLRENSVVTFHDFCEFIANTASNSGGAIASTECPLWTVDNTTVDDTVRRLAASSDKKNRRLTSEYQLLFNGNIANLGSAVYFYDVSDSSNIQLENIELRENEALIGGTIFWLYDHVMTGPPRGAEDSSTIVFTDNSAPYGTLYATQGVYLTGADDYAVEVYGQVLTPPLTITLLDYYNQSIPTAAATKVAATIFTAGNGTECLSTEPSIGGADTIGTGVSVRAGVATFSKLAVICNPTGNLTLNFEATINAGTMDIESIADGAYNINTQTKLHFRSCSKGEFTNNIAECETCAFGSYSLQANASSCRTCTNVAGVLRCEADQVELELGYWRRYSQTNAVLSCPLAPESCPGGNSSGQESCGVGYTGELCAVCDVGYFAQGTECFPCRSSSILSPTLLVYFIIFGVIALTAVVVILVYYKYYKKADDDADHEAVHNHAVRHNITTVDDHGVIHTQVVQTYQEDKVEDEVPIDPSSLKGRVNRIYVWGRANYYNIMGKFKIVMSTYQIISVIGSDDGAEETEMPGAFQKMANMLKVVNLSVASIVPISCSETYTFIDSLYFATLMPVAIAAILVILAMWSYTSAAANIDLNPRSPLDAKKEAYAEIRGKYMAYFLVLTYAVLPSVTTTIFKIFLCTDVDPENETPSGDSYYLVADMRISCDSDYYYNGVAFACLMILVYPIGIPLLYLYSLYYWQEDIKTRDDYIELTVELDKEMSGEMMAKDAGEDEVDEETERDASNSNTAIVAATTDANVTSLTGGADVATSKGIVITSGEGSDTPVMVKKQISAGALRLNFLWKAYEPQFWYWEVIETTRRLMLTAVLSVIAPGSPAQTVVAIMLAMLYMKVYDIYEPYDDTTSKF